MSASGPDPALEGRAVGETQGSALTEDVAGIERARWLLALAGMIAGLGAFGIGEATYQIIPARKIMLNTMGTIAPAVTAANQSVADVRNAALAYAVLGACLGGCLGIAGGLARRSRTAAAAAGALGVLLGSGLAAGLSLATLQAFADARFRLSDHDMELSMLMHGLIWGLIGAAAGLAFAIGLGGRRRLASAAVAGLVGAALGAVVFDLVGAAFFATADTGDPISTTWTSRLTARLLVALATAAGLILSLSAAAPVRPGRGRTSPPHDAASPST